MDDKTKSIVAHITLIGWVIALVMNQSDKGENTSFYLRQMLGLFVLSLAGWLLGVLTISILSTIVGIGVLVLWVLSLLGALSGQKTLTPVVGQMFQDWFKSIN